MSRRVEINDPSGSFGRGPGEVKAVRNASFAIREHPITWKYFGGSVSSIPPASAITAGVQLM